MVREHPLGVLAVFGKHRGIFGAEEVGLLAAFADQAAVALGKDRLAGERRRVEETLRQNEKMASLGRLLAGVAHELNNPLTVVIGNAQLLQREMRGDGPVQRVGQIVDAGERCARIIRSFLAIARQQPPDRGVVDVNDVIHAALEMLQYSLRVHDIDVVVELADDLPDVWADHQQLHQVLVNLLSNAQDALREIPGPRALTIRSSEASLPRRIVIELIDAGRGMDAETQGRIFDPFFTTKPVGQGTGLGLSVCHAIIAAHDGHLSVESQAGHGTTVRIEFPVMEHPAVARATEALTTIGNQKRILLVDDEPMVRAVLGTMLSNDGHEIVTAEDGLSAVRALERGPFDLIIADIKMPVLDGPGLYRQLQTRHSGLEDRMIFITGDVLSSETKEFLETVRPVSLTKPFGIEALRSAIACVFRATH
jgi:signal transduction histidine kinase